MSKASQDDTIPSIVYIEFKDDYEASEFLYWWESIGRDLSEGSSSMTDINYEDD